MKIGGFEISGKKVLTGIGLFTAGTIAAVMGKSKLTDSVSKAEDEPAKIDDIDDEEIVELMAEAEETAEPEVLDEEITED